MGTSPRPCTSCMGHESSCCPSARFIAGQVAPRRASDVELPIFYLGIGEQFFNLIFQKDSTAPAVLSP